MTDNPEPGSFMSTITAKDFQDFFPFHDYVLASVFRVQEYHEFLLTDVPLPWGQFIFDLLDEQVRSK